MAPVNAGCWLARECALFSDNCTALILCSDLFPCLKDNSYISRSSETIKMPRHSCIVEKIDKILTKQKPKSKAYSKDSTPIEENIIYYQ